MISKEEVQHIAKLARLGLAGQEEGKFQKELSSILNYIEKLKKVETGKTAPTAHPFAVKNVFRKDEPKPQQKDLLALAPETKDGYLKVKSILR
jgi:aspartyl-tRNA(Asn)/glutamyl-tRNA(Gln) amidotransferase subunit C